MTILTGSLTSLQLSGSSLVQRKDTGAEVLLDMDFTTLTSQALSNNAYNSVGGYTVYLTRHANSNVSVFSGKGISYDSTTDGGFAYVFWRFNTFTGSVIQASDRLRVVAEFSGTQCQASPADPPNLVVLGVDSRAAFPATIRSQLYIDCRGPDSSDGNKFRYNNLWTSNGYASSTAVDTNTGATTSFSGAIRLELDGTQENWYTAADRSFSPPGLTEFPEPGDITPQARFHLLTNTGMPKLINSYSAPFTSSTGAAAADSFFIGFAQNEGGLFSVSLQRLTIFRYGVS